MESQQAGLLRPVIARLAAGQPQSLPQVIDGRRGMPGVGRMFAMPKMKKYSHTIILGDDANLIAKFPEQKNKVTVLKLDGGKVASVKYWTPGTDALDDYLK